MRSNLFFLLGLLIFSTNVLAAEMYRWLDDQGQVHFGDKPPNDKHEIIEFKGAKQNVDLTPHLKLSILPKPFRKPEAYIFLNEFRKVAPLPDWWLETELKPGTRYKTRADLLALWGSEKRCCDKEKVRAANRRMFKAAYNSILEYDEDEHALAFALKYLNNNYVDYPQQLEVQKLALKYFFYYQQKVDWCVCKHGDLVARQIYFLGQHYRKAGQHLEYVALIKKFLDERYEETSQYALAELYRQMAEAYLRAEYYRMAVAVIDEALTKLDNEYGSPAQLKEIKYMKKRRDYILKHYRKK